MNRSLKFIGPLIFSFFMGVFGQQIDLPRVEQMPNQPKPYEMRDWKQVAQDYDSYVFDFSLSGTYLPLIWLNENTVNYPGHRSFGLQTAVGTYSPGNAEAINILPAVVGASLVGIDKSDQNGHQWVLYCEEFFNNRPEEMVYLNGPVTSSGSDWWYDTMPNIFFYQLNDLYPNTGDFENQMVHIADQWLKAVKRMGGTAVPWHKPYMNYRAFRLSTMLPNTDGVKQPEAAGAIGWLLYNAYQATNNEEYRIGAEWCMEFLSGLSQNPAYELQLPYGVYLAARMNAELGTSYNVDKLLNWCFTPEGNVREWGVTLGQWGAYDCYGLVGEARYDGYAFVMNGYQQAAALVPMVRYDDRYARAIGKWVLNLANASRLFYTNYLPQENQDGESWSYQYDPASLIAHEALREKDLDSDNRPFATGDFARSGWGALNFALYGASHVGYLAAIVDTTDVSKILELDVLKTDFYSDSAYATFIYFNPYDQDTSIAVQLPDGTFDMYDAVNNQYIKSNVTGTQQILIPADMAMMIVQIPSGGSVSYEYGRLLVNDIVVDFNSGQPTGNRPPRFKSLVPEQKTLFIDDSMRVFATATDPDGDNVEYSWSVAQGEISGEGKTITYLAKNAVGMVSINCIISDPSGAKDTTSISIEVINNHNPEIKSLKADPAELNVGETTSLHCDAIDGDGDSLQYIWQSDAGSFSGTGATVQWQAPDYLGFQKIYCTVNDGNGGQAIDSLEITIGRLVAFYSFSGNAIDSSGFENHGVVNGAQLTSDRFGQANSAYLFDGQTDNITVPVTPAINCESAISVNFWMQIDEFFDREAYPISHGNWENRWKVSITNKKIRWTIKTDNAANNGIKDLDSQGELQTARYYNVCAIYDGRQVAIYIDGKINVSTPWNGKLLQTPLDLMIGQALPGNTNNNFKGILDDIRIYNSALSAQEVQDLYETGTRINPNSGEVLPKKYALDQNYPNPFNPATVIGYRLSAVSSVDLSIYNLLGEKVTTMVNKKQAAGSYQVEWDGSNFASGVYIYRLQTDNGFVATKKLILIK